MRWVPRNPLGAAGGPFRSQAGPFNAPEGECETMATPLRAEVLETSSLFQLAIGETVRTQEFAGCDLVAVYDL